MNNARAQMQLAGRSLLALLFVVDGIQKLMEVAGTAAYLARLGMPLPEAMVWVAIGVEIGGGALLIIGWHARAAAWLMIGFVVIATLLAHRFWEFGAAQQANQMHHFLKNAAIIGGLLYIIAFGPGVLSVDERRGAVRPAPA